MSNNFIIVGAQRSGTTFLYQLLGEHPEICMNKPVRPEPKYFLNKKTSEIDLEFYESNFFDGCSPDMLKGEKSTSYYENENSARLISSVLPDAKIIFCLRNPTNRALSNYYFSLNNGLEKRSLIDVFINKVDAPESRGINTSVNPFDYLGRGDYMKYIEIYRKYFPEKQIRVVIFEELLNNLTEISTLYEYLKVDAFFVPSSVNTIVNASEKTSRVPLDVMEYLSSYYKSSIESLESMLNRKVSVWR